MVVCEDWHVHLSAFITKDVHWRVFCDQAFEEGVVGFDLHRGVYIEVERRESLQLWYIRLQLFTG